MKEECLICKAPLEYLKEDIEMECELCHKKEKSKTRCVNGHYVCNECHMQGIDSLIGICMGETSKNPVIILNQMMSQPFCHMHGPEHHVMVGMALLTAYKNSGGDIDLGKALVEMNGRGSRCREAPADSGAPAAPGSVQECFSPLLRVPPPWERTILACPIR